MRRVGPKDADAVPFRYGLGYAEPYRLLSLFFLFFLFLLLLLLLLLFL